MNHSTSNIDQNSDRKSQQVEALLFFKRNNIISILEEVINKLYEERPDDSTAYIVTINA